MKGDEQLVLSLAKTRNEIKNLFLTTISVSTRNFEEYYTFIKSKYKEM